ncbi:MAG: hypothetical protein HY253_10105 [Burkholderiales bacterium]|nr:hypothetical protein [Burkholderiales bacterium]
MTPRLKTLVAALAMIMAVPALAQNNQSRSFDAITVAKAVAAKEPIGLRTSAEAGLRTLINDLSKDIPAGTLPDNFPFEINDISELRNAKLGMGFEVHTAHPQTLLAGGRPFEQMLMGTGIWNFVVLVDGHPAALLEMEKVNGKWQVNGAGGSKLAQDVHQTTQQNAGRNAFRFVRIYQATADFLEVKDMEGKSRFAPLLAARQSLRMPANSALEQAAPVSADVLPALQGAVREHLARFKQ